MGLVSPILQLAQLAIQERQSDRADELSAEALRIAKASREETDPELIEARLLRAQRLLRASALEEAKEQLSKVKRHNPRPSATAQSSIRRTEGALWLSEGRYAKAEKSFAKNLAELEKRLGNKHPAVPYLIEPLAIAVTAQGDEARALPLRRCANQMTNQYMHLALEVGSEESWQQALELISVQTHHTLDLALRGDDSGAHELALETLLERKARLQSSTRRELQALREELDGDTQDLLDEALEARSKLVTELAGPIPERLPLQIESLREQHNETGYQLWKQAKNQTSALRPVKLAQIRSRLPKDAALLEFARYHPLSLVPGERLPARYAGCVLRAEGAAQCRGLGDADRIDKDIRQLRAALSDPRTPVSDDVARRLGKTLVDPLRPSIGDAALLLIAPDSALNLLPFDVLEAEGGASLLDQFTVQTLSTGRELLRNPVRSTQREAVLIGDPDFGPGSGFRPLPETAAEISAVAGLLGSKTTWTRKNATEARLRAVARPKVLHVATHSFFLQAPGETASVFDPTELALRSGPRLPGGHWEDPLRRSGLALAGANLTAESDDSDGKVSALELMGLDLRGTQLVVLSACETGLGEVLDGEGVFGLRHALSTAGAETQLTSLWKVNDEATRALMVAYYERLARGEGRGAALREAKREVRAAGTWTHPFFWAGFVASGDWRPLSNELAAN